MRRIVIWLASTVTIVVLLFGYHTSTSKTSPAAATTGTSTPTTSSGSSNPTASPRSKITTYTGSVAQTRWGPVQVKITVQGRKITKVTVLQQPNGNPRDAEINSQALPILIDETVRRRAPISTWSAARQ